ncbi:MAG TPA: hypothetical protein VFN10_21180 [Thermoanaerobaculia bacterium]|nr:hypothetical protein [Thermoanaerobaculia bacterium]
MRRSLLFALLGAVALFSIAARTTTWQPTPYYNVRVSVVPAQAGPYHLLPGRSQAQYRATATVTDETNTKVVVTTRDLLVAPGDRRTTTAEGDGLVVGFEVKVAENASGAETEVVVKRGNSVVTKNATAVVLASPR